MADNRTLTFYPPPGGRFDLTDAGHELDRLETGGEGRWTYTGDDSLESRLYRAAADGSPVPSTLPVETVESHLLRIFEQRP